MPNDAELPDVPELTFPIGMPGFPDSRRFALSRWGGEDSPYALLVCLDDPDLAFVVTPPEAFFDDYRVQLPDDDVRLLQLEQASDALVLVIVNCGARPEDATANLLGPVVLNTKAMTGAQIVLMDSDRGTRVPLYAA